MSNIDAFAFLREAKQLISVGKKDFIKRTYDHPSGRKVKWIEALLDIGLSNPSQAWDETLKLTPDDFIDGPCEDSDRPHEGKVIWIFKKEINGVSAYIKLKIDSRRGCVCLSFHKDW
ncbi:hypothetical protein AWM68_20640 [Fictibacillus phosphorivorans]|uniref:Type II toxin-antitoxin system MqsR family toxin n=1 Tax=Fictibacillus phosphorivorans TaxID=1221500 RepID=A0A165NDV7_9BACL|nr:hypothetical protein [Fictibacillus phosphorivorans]KZE65612.1 hypothetical protein AWM68_20640 [Fictibacillus phosphorivorans]